MRILYEPILSFFYGITYWSSNCDRKDCDFFHFRFGLQCIIDLLHAVKKTLKPMECCTFKSNIEYP